MSIPAYICLPVNEIPNEPGWLQHQSCPVIAVGQIPATESPGSTFVGGAIANADLIVASEKEATGVINNIRHFPIAAMAYVQVLRCVDHLPLQSAMTVESLAYATLQGGTEFQGWSNSRADQPQLISGGEGPAIIVERDDNVVKAILNRPENRNSLSVEMRDALIEIFEVVIADTSIERLQLGANGACFSVGGELREFGLFQSTSQAHWVRSVQNPSRLLARCASRVHCHVHSACLGSGMEVPAFAGRVTADPKTFFQLPELKLGLIPGAGGCVSISRRIGRHRTAWLGLSCKKINAVTALEWGLIDEIVS